MKRRTIQVLAISLSLVALTCFYSFTTTRSHGGPKADRSGEAYYKAIFFSQGELAQQIPELQQGNVFFKKLGTRFTGMSDAVEDFGTQVIADIHEKHPEFFAAFKTAMDTKNPLRIYDALNIAKAYYHQASDAIVQKLRGNTCDGVSLAAQDEKIAALITRYNDREIGFQDFYQAMTVLRKEQVQPDRSTTGVASEEGVIVVPPSYPDIDAQLIVPPVYDMSGSWWIYYVIAVNVSSTENSPVSILFSDQLALEKFSRSLAEHI